MNGRYRVGVVPGEGVVVHWPSAVLAIGGTPAQAEPVLSTLMGDSPQAPASGLLLERLQLPMEVDLAAAVSTPTGFRLFSKGAGVATSLKDDEPIALGSREFDMPSETGTIWIGIGLQPSSSIDERMNLERGVVPGRGAFVEPQTTWTPLGQEPTGFDLVNLASQDVDRRNPLPSSGPPARPDAVSEGGMPGEERAGHSNPDRNSDSDDSIDRLRGIECNRGHFNNPLAAYCQVCGLSMVHLTHQLIEGDRPTLGFLVFDDGSTFALDRQYLVGRDPTPEDGSGLQGLSVDDIDNTVSREHLEVRFQDWEVVVHDLGSTNGSFYWDTATNQWDRILPNRPVVVRAGSTVAAGRKTFVYEPVVRSTE